MVLAAGRGTENDAVTALETLCETYWFPLYAFVRRRGFAHDQAADLTQGFFADLLQRQDLQNVDPQKGRFRAFLLTAISNYIGNQLDFQKAQKRGGNVKTLSLDFEQADQRIRLEPFHEQTAESEFLKEWALTLLEKARHAIRAEFAQSDRAESFDELQVFLSGDRPDISYQQVGEKIGKSAGAVKVAVHRLRQRFHQQIRQEIACTVATEAEIDAEIHDLFDALRS